MTSGLLGKKRSQCASLDITELKLSHRVVGIHLSASGNMVAS